MLTPPDFVDDSEKQEIYNFAPAELRKQTSQYIQRSILGRNGLPRDISWSETNR
jgi:hypothetical protein